MKKMMLLTITILAWCHVACPMDDKQNQLSDAIKEGDLQQVHMLLASGANINQIDKQGDTPLILAIMGDKKDIVKLLLDSDADINQANKQGYTPLILAVNWDKKDIVKLLLDSDADINQANKQGYTPLIWAINWGNKDIVKLLLDSGADPNQAEKRGYTPLMEAILRKDKDIVKLLLYSGADPNLKNTDNKTAFDYDSEGYIKSVREDMIREFTTFLEGSESYGLPKDMLVEIGRKTLPFANDQQIRNMINSVKRIIDIKEIEAVD